MSPHIFETTAAYLAELGLKTVTHDFSRPWGGFFVLEEAQIRLFAETFFPHLIDELPADQKFSPKILMVAPHKRLSWQYHFRRAEVWRVVSGPIAVAQSDSDAEQPPKTYHDGEFLVLKQGERHRLIGLDDWGVVAEIWQHTDPQNPSNEDDIVRVQDDFSR